jgi:MGT family glycosyltransferase
MGRVAAIFCMAGRGHLQRLLPLVTGLARHGMEPVVFSNAIFRDPVERAGGRLIDLFARYPLDAADALSRPVPSRYVSFAARYVAPLLEDVARLRPALVVYDTFAVIGRVLGRHLGVPYVNVCAGHNMSPARAIAVEQARVTPSDACRRAVEVLRERWGILDASPMSYFTGLSPFLNVYCEPAAFLRPEERAAFEPVAFFGSVRIPDPAGEAPALGEPPSRAWREAPVRVYVSFGTVVWRYFETEALRALAVIAGALGARDDARAVISLGGHPVAPAARAQLERANVEIVDYVDQWRVLQDASVYLTHQGLNSTHEAIYHLVPMISHPFFVDQPGLATRCQELGLAIPLAGAVQGVLAEGDVHAAFARLAERWGHLKANLARARSWEIEVMQGREAVIQRIVDLR